MATLNTHHLADLEARVNTIFARQLDLEIPSVDTDLLESGLLDSLKFVELLRALEMDLSIKLPFEDLELDNFRSIQRIALVVTKSFEEANGDSPQ
jgi:acyl carrier protein